MKIEKSDVVMDAARDFTSEREVTLDYENSFRTLFDGIAQAGELSTNRTEEREKQVLLMLQALISRMLELISGTGKQKVCDLREVLNTDGSVLPAGPAQEAPPMREMTWTSQFSERIFEHESTHYTSTGKIQTVDGRTLDFNLDLSMCRTFACERTVSEQGKIQLRDPLVINFDGKAAELSGKRFAFDLDADGRTESIPGLAQSSGFLAIDQNADGHINDGSELFGARSGNGFADLAVFDKDGNHWIDETDSIFDALRIWQRDDSGVEQLSSLREQGIGALYLGASETQFSLTDDENRLLAQIRASGFYLRESGSVGSVQQIDLAV